MPPKEALAAPGGDSVHYSLVSLDVPPGNLGLPVLSPAENGASWNPEWSSELGLLRPSCPDCHPVLALGLSSPQTLPRFVPKNSPCILHDAAQPVVRTLAVP